MLKRARLMCKLVLCVFQAVLSVVLGAWSVMFVGWADWVDCRCFFSCVFLGVARRLELSPCITEICRCFPVYTRRRHVRVVLLGVRCGVPRRKLQRGSLCAGLFRLVRGFNVMLFCSVRPALLRAVVVCWVDLCFVRWVVQFVFCRLR